MAGLYLLSVRWSWGGSSRDLPDGAERYLSAALI